MGLFKDAEIEPFKFSDVADPHVLAQQRAENFAVVLLGSPEWNARARGAVQKRLAEKDRAAAVAHAAALRVWIAGGKQGPEPQAKRPSSDADVMQSLGADLAIDAYWLALGFAEGVALIEGHVRAQEPQA